MGTMAVAARPAVSFAGCYYYCIRLPDILTSGRLLVGLGPVAGADAGTLVRLAGKFAVPA